MQVRVIGVLFALLLVAGSVAAIGPADIRVTEISHGGDGYVENATDDNRTFVWVSERHRVDATVETDDNASGVFQSCLYVRPVTDGNGSGNVTELECQVVSYQSNDTKTVSFTGLRPPGNASDKHRLFFVVRDRPNGGEELINNSEKTLTYVTKDGDYDGDGLSNVNEVANGTHIANSDTDGDGLSDGDEVHIYGTNSTDTDTDGDGLRDALEVTLGTNPRKPIVPYLLAAVGLIGTVAFVAHRYGLPPDWERRRPEPAPRPDEESPASGPDTLAGPATETDVSAAPDRVLTDEDRILQILAENDGRLMQSELVEETGWSKSKVSRRLSALEEEEEISKISLGRQNIVTLPGKEPEGTKSPLDE